jgi:hypothetical protein
MQQSRLTAQRSLGVPFLGLLIVLATGLAAGPTGNAQDAKPDLTPFVLPWDDASPGVTNLSDWLPKPAGKFGHVVATADGHLQVGDRRIRFFGTDLSHSANFPLKPDAEKIAARMAKFGINIVRFHIMDIAHFPQGLFREGSPNTREFQPEAIDRMDYFISQLKKNGIYVDLNLLNYRGFCEADGLPKEIEIYPRPYNLRHMPGFVGYERHLELQREYARMLLAHRNPYTGLSYTEDPAIAFVEICNENGLISSWVRGKLDGLPEVFLGSLRQQWNDWLKKRYGTTDALRQAWDKGGEPLGKEMLSDAGPLPVLDNWERQNGGGAESDFGLSADVPAPLRAVSATARSLCVKVNKLGSGPWHVLLNRPGFAIEAGRTYTLSFWAKARGSRSMRMQFCRTSPPWRNLSNAIVCDLTPEWQQFRFLLKASEDNDKARVMIGDLGKGLGKDLGAYWIADFSLRPGGVLGLRDGEQVEDGSIPLFPHGRLNERTPPAQRDWFRFLRDTEEKYWQGMYRYLKNDLQLKAMVIGTASQYSTPNLMAEVDCVDCHAYWQHPRFLSARRWGGPWIVQNESMVNATGGTIRKLAAYRVLDKPFCVTEYGSASPNPHTGENLLLGGAYAALQDWDYIAVSRYTRQVRDDYSWGSRAFRGFFDVDQHPTRMLGFIPAAAMFRRGDVRPAEQQVVVPFDRDRELDALQNRGTNYEVISSEAGGEPQGTALVHRLAKATEGTAIPAAALDPAKVAIPGPRYVSDTGELVWDRTDEKRGVVTINTARSKAVIGFGAGKRFELGGVVIEPGPTRQDGWSVVSLTAIKGELARGPARIVVIATGDIENEGMKWTNEKKESVDRNWGTGPTLVETVPARLTLPVSADKVRVWALDERGQRGSPLGVEAGAGGNAVIAIGPPQRTLWYEIEVQ